MIVAGLFWSRALQSAGCGLVFLHPFVNGNVRSALRELKNSSRGLLLALYYLLILVSYLWTTDVNAWWDKNMILKLPMVLLPFGVLAPNAFDRKRITRLLYFFIFAAWTTGIVSFVNYLMHYAEINESIIRSKPIPILTAIGDGAYHIYYSLMLAFAALAGLYFLWQKGRDTGRWAMAFFTLCNIIFLHVIAARTGLVGFYGALAAGLIYIIVARRKIIPGLIGFAVLALATWLTLTQVPSMRNRLENTRTDLTRYRTGQDINYYSISMRLEALKTAWTVFKRSPITGAGPGDIKREMTAHYELDKSPLMPENRHLPHHQFLQTLAMLGIIGGVLLLLIFLWPGNYRHIEFRLLSVLFMVLCFVSFQFESVLERQVGLTFFVLFYMVLGRRGEE